MGGNGSKQTKEKIILQTPEKNSEYKSTYELPQRKRRHHRLQNPYNDRPVELSWLQQTNTNDNYNRIDPHHHIHYDERLRRVPLAINRWPNDNNQTKEQKPKSFIEEYIHQ